ncbi:12644_t:CDS:2 [Cetraspora pellucida]|uniref:12644_t:CDS:1 n=1 Tax=Cetraspora pellucida TaxID=1433469 RepID=A0A9N9N5M1_9GLOM|nr:12644_t:CDS:2 [Cetraspora pellucida]
MSIAELSNYAEELVKHLKDAKAHDHAQNQIQKLEFNEKYDCPEFFYLENVQKRLKDCNITNSPTMQNLIDIMIMLSMRLADVANLRIDYYKPSNADWYDPKYSWYCTGYAKNKQDESRPLVSMKKDSLLARELLIWIQKAIPN